MDYVFISGFTFLLLSVREYLQQETNIFFLFFFLLLIDKDCVCLFLWVSTHVYGGAGCTFVAWKQANGDVGE